ncbi:MAG: restriction endonuclease subunit S [Pseudolabrys sp.]|nr:restriction endonuclease subunit S [Pseudolabrys sp.]
MAREWRASTWGEEISLEYGKALRDYDKTHGKFRVFGSNGPIGWTEQSLAPGPGVILGRKGAYRGIQFCHEPFFVIDTAYYVVPKTELDMRWLYYAITYHKLGEIDEGSPIPSTTRSAVYVRDLDVPPSTEQKAIAAVLGALDDKIELSRRMNATLEAMARALFQSWFVDFDPVRAKLDGVPPAGLDPATAALFPEHFEEGEYGKLPVGWRHIAIDEVCAMNAWTLGKDDDLETLEYIEISEVSRGNIANIDTYTRGEEPSRARRRLRHGDTVLSTVRPDRGSYFLALNPPKNRVASTGFAVLTPTKAPWSFVHAAMTQPEVSDHLGQMADGGAYPAVRPEIIGNMKVAVPNEPKILEAFHRTCAPLFEQAEANRTQSRTLATLRDTLLPKLLSGELRAAPASPSA